MQAEPAGAGQPLDGRGNDDAIDSRIFGEPQLLQRYFQVADDIGEVEFLLATVLLRRACRCGQRAESLHVGVP
ncbi:hypothetical protein D3C83_39680 [compost metagenome]